MSSLKDFTNLYPLSKTLRFRLEPQGKTSEFINRNQLLENDERLAKEYTKAKEVVKGFHRSFINSTLNEIESLALDNPIRKNLCQLIDDVYNAYTNSAPDALSKYQALLRKNIVDFFNNTDIIKNKKPFQGAFVEKHLADYLENDEDKQTINRFKGFTTYFSNFLTNIKNIYSQEDKSTALAHRIVNDNLMKFIDNINVFNKVIIYLPEDNIKQLYSDFEQYLNVLCIQDYFKLDNYLNTLTQTQIELYNAIIGGRTDKGEKVAIKGLNQYINLYNQAHKDQRLPKLKPLFNQILSIKESVSFIPEKFDNASEVLLAIKEMWKRLHGEDGVLVKLMDIMVNIDSFQPTGIFIPNDLELTDICQKHFGKYDAVKNALIDNYKAEHPIKKGQKQEKYDELIKKHLKSIRSLSLAQINALLPESNPVQDYFKQMGAINNENKQRENLFALIQNRRTSIESVLSIDNPTEQDLKNNVEFIKDFLDAVKDLQRFLKPLNGAGDESNKDDVFYSDFTPLYESLNDLITPLYMKVQSYITRNPKDENKFKINFECATLLKGWAYSNGNYQYRSIILRNNYHFYLAIIYKDIASVSRQIIQAEAAENNFEKIVYKQFVTNNISNYITNPVVEDSVLVAEAERIYNEKSFNKGDNFKKDDLTALIDFYKKSLKTDDNWSGVDFKFLSSDAYETLMQFKSDLEKQAYQLGSGLVPVSLINKLVDEGKLFLFKITGKDFSPHSKGRPNLHTIYWRMLFDEQNLKDVVYKLNGQAEIFFRRKFVTDPVIHKANKPVTNKSDYNKQHKPTSEFAYDIVKDRRFTLDQFTLHVPITMNFKAQGNGRLNDEVKSFIKNQGIRHIIGIDRGERHLLYLTMIDMQGNIVKQCSLNSIASNPEHPDFSQNYHDILDKKEGNRLQARRNWTTIENIKELKEGYLSQIVHVLAKMMVENDAILVLENLNTGFMRGRQKVEKSVYLKFEKMLIDKLNYLVDKTAEPNQPLGALKALQLTEKYDDFNKYQKGNVRQCGFVFYIPAWNTSKLDPATGFVNLFDTRLDSMQSIKAFFSKFDSIRYNQQNDWFEFAFDYNNFTTKADGVRSKWTLCSVGYRIETKRSPEAVNKFASKEIDLNGEFKQLFGKVDSSTNLKQVISQMDGEHCKQLLHLFKLMLQMRNSETGTDIDYLVSPVADKNGNFFDSRTCNDRLPANADANGAFNIARKGLMLVEQIQQAKSIAKVDYDMSNKNWLKFAQNI